MPKPQKKGWKSSKSTKIADSTARPIPSSAHAAAVQRLDASLQTQESVENTQVAGQFLRQDQAEPARSFVTMHERQEYTQANDYAVIEHKGDASQLQLWAYEVDNNNLTVAERLEKLKWEAPRYERL